MMPSVIEAPEFITDVQEHEPVTKRLDKPSTTPVRSALHRVLRALVSREDTRYQATHETAVDRLARQDPYLYIRSMCG